MQLHTNHFHNTEATSGLRQCSCGAWTLNGVNWALDPQSLAPVPAFPTGRDEDVTLKYARPVMPTLTIEAAVLETA